MSAAIDTGGLAALADDCALQAALQAANLPTLLLVLVQLTGDVGLLRGQFRPKRASPQRSDGGFDPAQAQELRARARQAVLALRDGRPPAIPLPDPALMHEMMSFSLGQPVPPEYVPMMSEEMRFTPRPPVTPRLPAGYHVVIIGGGMSGILAAIELAHAGIAHTVIEKNAEYGGTWFENTYPGCRVDLPSHFYCYSFEPNADWSQHFAPGEELFEYFRHVAHKHGVPARTRFRTEVVAASFDEASARWRLTLREADGREARLEADAVISAVGQLNRPAIPPLAGIESFAGPCFHSADYRHDIDLRGKRVGIIGTGASAMQLVPKLAPQVEKLVVFQRSPQWATPHPDYFRDIDAASRWLLRHLPYYAQWYRFRVFYLHADGMHESLQIDPLWEHPERSLNAANDRLREMLTRYIEGELGEHAERLRDKVVPAYPPFAKRMLIDNHWFRTLTRENVELVTEAIAGIEPAGVCLAGGGRHELDALVVATGFQANRFLWPITVTGVGGQILEEIWGDDPHAHLGITVPGFPNFFMLYGPNTNLAHGGTIIFHSECQMHYIMASLKMLSESGRRVMECRQAACDAYNSRVDAAHARMVWTHPGAHNWYRNRGGRVTTNSPFRLVDYWQMTRAPSAADFDFR